MYIFDEDIYLKELKEYVDLTYKTHYGKSKYQATEVIIDSNHGIGFTLGNIIKYAKRYGHKGSRKDWRMDILKIIHYALILLYTHDKNQEDEPDASVN